MLKLNKIHHVAIICSDYTVSKHFYCQILGLTLLNEKYREEIQSWKAELALGTVYQIELFSFPDAPARLSYPEARGLRHVAFAVDDLDASVAYLQQTIFNVSQYVLILVAKNVLPFFKIPMAYL